MSFFFSEKKKRQKEIEHLFEGREPLSEISFYEHYFAKTDIPSEVVIGVRKVLESVLEADLSQLSSSDDFSTNLSFFFDYDSMADVEIVTELEKEFDIKISDQEAEKAKTICNIIELVWHKKLEGKA